MHCSHKAIRKVRKAAITMPNVAHTSFRKVDLLGAIRKYETRIDSFTKLEAETKRVCPAIDAFRPFCRS